jgi:hypothetical protein
VDGRYVDDGDGDGFSLGSGLGFDTALTALLPFEAFWSGLLLIDDVHTLIHR